ncbi:sulfotransferase domain-containing protein [Flammeovirga sp. OC4]|uniref:sulfotransferase domain-containing protein n=1 Tax=Flammeovirga sp. OC4 TaxID=1382345 RepID=UPI0005C57F17|nr:sulfotransferase domain-containing protein [Flammeovirga sp. OC4]
MKKLIVHIGYPKTATTSLQLNLFTKLYKDNEIEYLNHLNKKSELFGNLYCGNIIKYITGIDNDIKYSKELIAIKESNKKCFVISNENISFFCENFSWAYYNNNARFNAAKIKEVFEGIFEEIKIIITLRSQITLIPSFYIQQYHHITQINNSFSNPKLWFEENFINNDNLIFNYSQLLNSYLEHFDESDLIILLYEDFKHDIASIIKPLSEILNIDQSIVRKNLSNKNYNVTISTKDGKKMTDNITISYKIRHLLRKNIYLFLPVRVKKVLKSFYDAMIEPILPKKNIKFTSIEINSNIISENDIVCIFNKKNTPLHDKFKLDVTKLIKYKYLKID